jgi:hypothetical protein
MNPNSSPVRFFCGGPGGTACTMGRTGVTIGSGAALPTVRVPPAAASCDARWDAARRASASEFGRSGGFSVSASVALVSECFSFVSAVLEAGCAAELWPTAGLPQRDWPPPDPWTKWFRAEQQPRAVL